ncbi:MAG TPA: hypothetical protein VK669_12005 [Candidatus Limnocylindrales bacterium]|nr:hypothetical protein [Candidatus Limnocylindrales bacterium]
MKRLALAGFAAVAALAAVLVGCGGGSTPPPAPASTSGFGSRAPAAYLGSVTPPQLFFANLGGGPTPTPTPTTIVASGFSGGLTVLVTAPRIVTVTPGVAPGSFTVTPLAAGQTSLVLNDGSSAVVVPVIVGGCLPPLAFLNGPVTLGVPADRQTGVARSIGRVLFWQHNFIGQIAPPFTLRLVGSDGSVLNGTLLSLAAPPPVVPPGVPADAVWSAATIPPLNADTLYQAQLISADIACLYQMPLGTFST